MTLMEAIREIVARPVVKPVPVDGLRFARLVPVHDKAGELLAVATAEQAESMAGGFDPEATNELGEVTALAERKPDE